MKSAKQLINVAPYVEDKKNSTYDLECYIYCGQAKPLPHVPMISLQPLVPIDEAPSQTKSSAATIIQELKKQTERFVAAQPLGSQVKALAEIQGNCATAFLHVCNTSHKNVGTFVVSTGFNPPKSTFLGTYKPNQASRLVSCEQIEKEQQASCCAVM